MVGTVVGTDIDGPAEVLTYSLVDENGSAYFGPLAIDAHSGVVTVTGDIDFENMKRGIIVGSAMASFCVEKFGPTRLKEINARDISGRIQQFKDLVSFEIELV